MFIGVFLAKNRFFNISAIKLSCCGRLKGENELYLNTAEQD